LRSTLLVASADVRVTSTARTGETGIAGLH
jgi:hypothetical protein